MKLHYLYFLVNIIRMSRSRRMKWAGHVAHMEEVKNAHEASARNPRRKRVFGRPKHRSEDHIETEVKIRWKDVN
jgi:hypothetical protein